MKHLAASLLIALSLGLTLAAPAQAFSMDFVLPNLTFPDSTTTVSTQSCVATATLPCK